MLPLQRWFLLSMRAQAIAKLPGGGRLLEIGAGTGLNFEHYPPGLIGVATEPSQAMIDIARRKARPERFYLVQSQAERLPFAGRTFDMALATLVLCSVVSAEEVLTELRRVVKPGGAVILLEHVRPSGLLGLIFDLLNQISVRLFADRFNRRTAETAAAAGLEVLEREKRLLGIINLIVCRV